MKLGDYLEYTPATGEPKNGAPGKPRATKVERAPRPKKPSKKQLELIHTSSCEAADFHAKRIRA